MNFSQLSHKNVGNKVTEDSWRDRNARYTSILLNNKKESELGDWKILKTELMLEAHRHRADYLMAWKGW